MLRFVAGSIIYVLALAVAHHNGRGRRIRLSVEAFCPSPALRRLHHARTTGFTFDLPAVHVENAAPTRNGRRRREVDRTSILLLNQRKLPRQILDSRADDNRALTILWEAYPYLNCSFDNEGDFGLDTPYEYLLGVLRGGEETSTVCNEKRNDTLSENETVIIDGKSIVATIEVLREARNTPAALHLLKLATDAMRHNQQVRASCPTEDKESDREKSELRRVYKSTLSLLGHNKLLEGQRSESARLIMYILHHHMPESGSIRPEAEMFHAAINALGRLGACDLILELLREMEYAHEENPRSAGDSLTVYVPCVDRMAYQTAISSLARHGRCWEATQVLHRMQSKGFAQPDMNIYNELLIGIAKEAGRITGTGADDKKNGRTEPWYRVALRILHEMETNGIKPTEQAYNSVISACGKEGQWDDAARVAERVSMPSSSTISERNESESLRPKAIDATATYFESLDCFCKIGKGKDAWWEIGRYTLYGGGKQNVVRRMIIGIQPHRNPVYNGLSLVFYDEESRVKLGRMLLKNASSKSEKQTCTRFYSSLVGMEVNKARRGEGLSKAFVAIWLRICLETNAYPRAAIMNKPLISYVLNAFDFVPQNGGRRVGLIRLSADESERYSREGFTPTFGLYSPSAKSLQGLFSHRVLRTQNIVILGHLPSSARRDEGSYIYLKTGFEHPISIAENAVEYIPHPAARDDIFLERLDTDEAAVEQRQKLEDRIHSVLKTNTTGELEFFKGNELLRRGFLTYVR